MGLDTIMNMAVTETHSEYKVLYKAFQLEG